MRPVRVTQRSSKIAVVEGDCEVCGSEVVEGSVSAVGVVCGF